MSSLQLGSPLGSEHFLFEALDRRQSNSLTLVAVSKAVEDPSHIDPVGT